LWGESEKSRDLSEFDKCRAGENGTPTELSSSRLKAKTMKGRET
jgi:hypothetical protein